MIVKDNYIVNKNISPESLKKSADGMQSKFYDFHTDMWYKQDYLGTEGLSEHIASLLLENSGLNYTKYNVCKFKNEKKTVIGCSSKNFLLPDEKLISTYDLIKTHKNIDIADIITHFTVSEKIKYFVECVVEITKLEEFGPYLTNILQLDAIIKNDDRHFNNISVIQKRDSSYKLAPIYDNGGAFLSDQYTYGDELSQSEIYEQMDQVQAKPFSLDFDEQLDACELLYPSNLKLQKNINLNEEYLLQFYKKNDIEKVKEILRQSQRKYSYLFCQDIVSNFDYSY